MKTHFVFERLTVEAVTATTDSGRDAFIGKAISMAGMKGSSFEAALIERVKEDHPTFVWPIGESPILCDKPIMVDFACKVGDRLVRCTLFCWYYKPTGLRPLWLIPGKVVCTDRFLSMADVQEELRALKPVRVELFDEIARTSNEISAGAYVQGQARAKVEILNVDEKSCPSGTKLVFEIHAPNFHSALALYIAIRTLEVKPEQALSN